MDILVNCWSEDKLEVSRSEIVVRVISEGKSPIF